MASIVAMVTGRPNRHVRWRRLLGCLLVCLGIASYAASVSYAQEPGNLVYVVHIRGEIDLGLAPYLSRVLEEARRDDARAVILEIDTPGGRLDAALQMRQAILDSPIRTIGFVNRTAFSAGALLAIAADEVYLAPGAVMGAATPVTGTGETADEKAISAVRTTFRSTAELRGRDPRVAEAMVDPSVAIDDLVTRDQLLTLTTAEAQAWGYADGVAEDRRQVLQLAGLSGAEVRETSPSLAEDVVRVLTNPVIASLLMSAGFLLVLADLYAGGLGASGAVGVGLLAIFFWGHMLAGLAGWEGVVLVLLGLVLLGVEVLVIPGFGVAGILGLASLAGGLFLSLIGGEIVTDADLARAGMTVGAALVMLLVGGLVLLRLLPKTAGYGGLVLRARLGAPDTPSRTERKLVQPAAGAASTAGRVPAELTSLVGAKGVAVSDLRPGGLARIRAERIDVVTEGDYVMAGEPVEVIGDEGYRRVVRRSESHEGDATATRVTSPHSTGFAESTGRSC